MARRRAKFRVFGAGLYLSEDFVPRFKASVKKSGLNAEGWLEEAALERLRREAKGDEADDIRLELFRARSENRAGVMRAKATRKTVAMRAKIGGRLRSAEARRTDSAILAALKVPEQPEIPAGPSALAEYADGTAWKRSMLLGGPGFAGIGGDGTPLDRGVEPEPTWSRVEPVGHPFSESEVLAMARRRDDSWPAGRAWYAWTPDRLLPGGVTEYAPHGEGIGHGFFYDREYPDELCWFRIGNVWTCTARFMEPDTRPIWAVRDGRAVLDGCAFRALRAGA